MLPHNSWRADPSVLLWLLECADMKDRIIAWVYNKLLIVPYIKKIGYFFLVTRFQKARKY